MELLEHTQINFTDPESRIMKNSNNKAFEQSYNAQAAIEHESRLIVGNTLSDHPNDKQEGVAIAQAIPNELGTPEAAAMDAGYFSPKTIQGLKAMGIDSSVFLARSGRSRGRMEPGLSGLQPETSASITHRLILRAHKTEGGQERVPSSA